MGLWYPKDSGFELTAFSDADHAGCLDTHKSTSGGIQFLGDKLVSWMSKIHDCTAISSAEAEYVALSASCAQDLTLYDGNPSKEILLKLSLPDHRYKRRCCSLIPAELNSLPHAHTQATKTYYKHQDSRINKAQELNTKTSATLIFKIFFKDIKIIKTKIVKGDC
ncbi:hypothetical protein Tco_0505391 [Tanacetum coccineum]